MRYLPTASADIRQAYIANLLQRTHALQRAKQRLLLTCYGIALGAICSGFIIAAIAASPL